MYTIIKILTLTVINEHWADYITYNLHHASSNTV